MTRAIVIVAALAFSAVVSAADDGLKVKVFTEGPQTVTVIQGCHSKPCINDIADVHDKGKLRVMGLFTWREQYLIRSRVENGAVVCEKFALVPEKWTDDEVAAKGTGNAEAAVSVGPKTAEKIESDSQRC